MEILLVIIFGSFLPLICYLCEYFLPKPEIVEEFGKLVLLAFLIEKLGIKKFSWKLILALALSFSFCETVFYGTNFYLMGRYDLVILRFLATVGLHFLTYVIIWFGLNRKRWWLLVGVMLLVMIVHNQFNFFWTIH